MVDVGDRLRGLGTSVAKDHRLAVRVILVLVLIWGLVGCRMLVVIAPRMVALEHGIIGGCA